MPISLEPHNIETYKKVIDKTKEFREIAKKITELSSTKVISLAEKIQIFEKFSKTGEELVGNTIFEGYPVGKWAIQIRNGLNRINNGKQEKQTINPTKEQLEKLKKLGILERQIDSTIDEKIDKLVEWRRKYPKAVLVPIVSSEVLREYAKTDEELKKLMEEYEKILNYYGYVRVRKSTGKLNEEQIEKCREGNVGGVFGNSINVNNENNVLMEKYGLNEEIINMIRKQYGSIDEFRKIYIDAVINQNVEKVINKNLLKNVNLINRFDISSPDWVQRNSGLEDLIYDISSERNVFTKYEGLEEKFIELIGSEGFNELGKQVLFMLYGVNGEKKVDRIQIAKEVGRSRTRVDQIVAGSIRKIKNPRRMRQLDLENRVFDMDYDLQKEIIEEYFKNFDIFVSKEPISMEENVKAKLTNMLYEGVKKTKKRNEQVDIIKRMSKEQKLDILKGRFGERINRSDISVVSPEHYVYSFLMETGYKDINEELLVDNWEALTNISYRECIDSEYCQSKIVEFMVNSFSNSELIKVGQKEKIEELIVSNEYFSEGEKNELKQQLNKRIKVAVDEKILNGMETWNKSWDEAVEGLRIDELDLSTRSLNCLVSARIYVVEDMVGKTEEEVMEIRNMGRKTYYEIIDKMASLGIEIVDGEFVRKKMDNIDSDVNIIEERINSNKYFSKKKKEELRELLHETFDVTADGNEEIEINLEDIEGFESLEETSKENIESYESLEEISKEELVKRILEQQRIIARQQEEINELSSRGKEEIDE